MSLLDRESPAGMPALADFLRGDSCLRLLMFLIAVTFPVFASAQARSYAGVLVGISTLSSDARSELASSGSSAFSLYDPMNGLSLSALVGRDLSEYVSVQGSYVWNTNRLSLTSTSVSSGMLNQFQEQRNSTQQSAIADVLVYFRQRDSRFRPYLSVGTGWVHFSSTVNQLTQSVGMLPLPPASFRSNLPAVHVPVGIDIKIERQWKFRYAFSETLTSNPISRQLSPPGLHRLMNFQSFFGIVRQF